MMQGQHGVDWKVCFLHRLMKAIHFSATLRLAAVTISLVLVSGSCRKSKNAEPNEAPVVKVVAPDLQTNGIAGLPGAVYQSQADSAIHWQPWTKATMDRAGDAGRLIFCVIAMPQQPGFRKILRALASDSSVVETIHREYVPVLVDGDASREMGLLTADLCAEIKRPLQLPLFVWMTSEGNAVAWIPVTGPNDAAGVNLFKQSHTMVSQMWKDGPRYVLKNSALDNANRRGRIQERKVTKVMSEQPAVDVVRCLRQLASLYDSYSRSFDEVGGLFPNGAIELLATAVVNPGLPADARARCLETTRELMTDLLPSAMFDPLDEGLFVSRRGTSWELPSFTRNCQTQSRAAMALIQTFRATGDPKILDKALGLLSFAEKSYTTTEGLFSVGLEEETTPEMWTWSIEDVEKALSPEDAAWWIKATGMKGLGNLPSEIDPRRDFFRENTLGLKMTLEEIAASQSQTVEAFKPRFEAAKAKLLAIRNARIGKVQRDDCSHAGATFRMVSAYAAAFGVTGNESYREKAVALLKRSREAFGQGPRLRLFSKDAPESIGAGRAFLYALALQSVLDVAAITSDEHWLLWSEDLATTAAELFTGDGFLKECPDDAKLIDLPITDLVMLFDDSTAGLVSADESRLAELGRPLVASFSELALPLPTYSLDRPVLHTDLLLATLSRHYKVTVMLGKDLPPALKLASQRLQLRTIHCRPATPDEQVPAGAIKVLVTGGESKTVTTPEALQEAVLPLPEK
jgi:uncharacterized protein YyaL (SSP411 family)